MYASKEIRVEMRRSDSLFESGEIFSATDKELESVIKEMASKAVPNPIARDREMIKAMVVTNIQNQRFIKSIENRNFVLTLIVIALAVIGIYFARLQVTPILFEQERNERRAYKICKNNPQDEYTGVKGLLIKCENVFDSLKEKFE
ncbi:MAG: hypothetical protein Q7S74_04455 [Nanoarchaeota archaeon]|nr:hypothetical protein [Nanoarchaeota archaeon]